jgi:hypothetical protein
MTTTATQPQQSDDDTNICPNCLEPGPLPVHEEDQEFMYGDETYPHRKMLVARVKVIGPCKKCGIEFTGWESGVRRSDAVDKYKEQLRKEGKL